jgi:NodT family efflux transporter outer membrane factor (OMF) lipoprotein
MKRFLFISTLALTLTACSSWVSLVTPTTPSIKAPASGWSVPEGFKLAAPSDHRIAGSWWESYQDPVLNDLEKRVENANQTLAQADAQYRQALAAVGIAGAALSPTANLNLTANRSQQPILTTGGLANPPASNLYQLTGQVSWEPDLWGAIHASVASAEATRQASAANRGAVLLSLKSQAAIDYLQLRFTDANIRLLEETEQAYARSVELTQQRFKSGVAARSDVTQATTQLETARANLADARLNRASLEHAIAVLVGESASDFRIEKQAYKPVQWPSVPLVIPYELLERRPDIANAQRQVFAATQKLNADEAAFFPVVTLSATAGFESKQVRSWLALPKSLWSIGPQITQYLLDGGNRTATRDQQLAVLDQSVANYREVVLESFQSVEDNLSALVWLDEEIVRQNLADRAARETLEIINRQYLSGTVSYLNVITAQTALLTAESNIFNVESRKAAAHVQLVKALGGGWSGLKN